MEAVLSWTTWVEVRGDPCPLNFACGAERDDTKNMLCIPYTQSAGALFAVVFFLSRHALRRSQPPPPSLQRPAAHHFLDFPAFPAFPAFAGFEPPHSTTGLAPVAVAVAMAMTETKAVRSAAARACLAEKGPASRLPERLDSVRVLGGWSSIISCWVADRRQPVVNFLFALLTVASVRTDTGGARSVGLRDISALCTRPREHTVR